MKFNVTLEDLRKLNPCYEPSTKLGENWSGTLIDILDHKDIKPDDKIWAVSKLIDDKTARLFAGKRFKIVIDDDPNRNKILNTNIFFI